MSAGLVNALLRQLRPRPGGSDGELLRRFAADRDEAAFEELMRRHGPLVWGVCRRALPNRADAEDAFQATFLVLARRARAVRKPDAVGCWLHGVAYRVARRMRGQPLHTSSDLADAQPARTESPADGPTVREFLAALDEELTNLPEKYRAPLVLCYLREQTRDEAARQLGVSLSTLKRRLETARERLRLRLARRGVELPATLAAATLAGTVPPTVASATLRAATTGTTAGVVSAQVLTVTEGVVRAMWETKLRAWAAGVFMATAAAGGGGYFVAHTGAAQPGDGPGQAAASDKPATERPAAQKLAGEDLSDPLARTKRLRELIAEVHRAGGMIEQLAARIEKIRREQIFGEQVKEKDLLMEMRQEFAAFKEAKRKFDALALQGPMVWDKPIPKDADGRIETQIALINQVSRLRAQIDDDRNQPRSPKSTQLETELEFATMELAAFRAATKTAQPAARGPVPPASPELRKLREEKLKAARHNLDAANGVLARGVLGSLQERYLWSKRVYEAERELDPSPAGRVKAARAHFDRMSAIEKAYANLKSGAIPEVERSEIRFYRLEAEIWLKEAEAARPRADAGDADSLRRILEAQQLQLEQLKRDAATRRAELRRENNDKKFGGPLGLAPIPGYLQPKLPANYRGKVTRRDSHLIVFEPGRDAGVQKGMTLRVQRPGDKGKQLGTVVVIIADPKLAAGQFTPAMSNPATDIKLPDDYPKPGDEVRPE